MDYSQKSPSKFREGNLVLRLTLILMLLTRVKQRFFSALLPVPSNICSVSLAVMTVIVMSMSRSGRLIRNDYDGQLWRFVIIALARAHSPEIVRKHRKEEERSKVKDRWTKRRKKKTREREKGEAAFISTQVSRNTRMHNFFFLLFFFLSFRFFFLLFLHLLLLLFTSFSPNHPLLYHHFYILVQKFYSVFPSHITDVKGKKTK